eukprot:TRINITY_DN1484_c0_g1_i1.p3 TRINITY_DN1484_c0_g1~~TRINITY_DN1484_c0_g1_i1.p3  ORF type:complete len:226 (-),score=64.89 TRINITY_DN1484_c0_g1_i1:2639-3316(-)
MQPKSTLVLFATAALLAALASASASEYSAKVPACVAGTAALLSEFTLDDGSAPAVQQTEVHVCYTNKGFNITFDCADNNIHNPYTDCNDPLYQYSVVEAFLAPADDVKNPPYKYVEIEVAPTGALFVANIVNTNGECSGISDELIPCNATEIAWSATRDDANNYWGANLFVPFSLFDHYGKNWQGNFFRIDTPKGQSKEYSCWSPTMASPACFHRPKYFGSLVLA